MSKSLKDDVIEATMYDPNPFPQQHDDSDFKKRVCGKKYSVAFKIDEHHPVEWLKGILLNYECGDADIETDDGYVVHIPCSGLKWLLPVKKKNNIESMYVGGINNEVCT